VVVIRTYALVAVMVATSGCASYAAQRARQRALEAQLAGWQGARPLDEVWQEARLLLAERGYPLAGKDAEAVGQRTGSWVERLLSKARETVVRGPAERSMETGWGRSRNRYKLESRARTDGFQVFFWRIDETVQDRPGQPKRDLELELALVRRVDPEAAARIDTALSAPVATSH
jgi:hypothetical protein